MGLRDVVLRVRSSVFFMPMTAMALSLAVFSFVPHGTSAVAQMMAMPGKFDVGGSGAAAYSIPIAVPPGTAGMTPALTLTYSSQGGNGVVGVGWSLSGLPVISRCPQTFAQDGVRGGVNFDSNDRYCLDGQRLLAISGVYGADGSEYRTEIESFIRVISHGAAGNGPAWFEVHTKSGQIMEFGHTADSQVLAQGKTTARNWAVNKVSDTKGNYFTVTYTQDVPNGQVYPARIDYTGNAGTSLQPYNSVQFVYATRPDITRFYQAGSLIQTTLRLTNVQSYAGTSLVADYRLAYDATTTSISSLTSVTVCASDGSCLPPTSFATTGVDAFSPAYGTYSGGTFTYPNSWNFGTQLGSGPQANYTPITGDFNGDGKTDFAFATGTLIFVFLSKGDGTFSANSFTFPNGWNFGTPPWANYMPIVGDFNGDGRTDFAFAAEGMIFVMLSNGDGTFSGNSFTYPNSWYFFSPHLLAGYTPIVGDFNNDGKTDFAFATGTWIAVFLSNGDGTFSGIPFNFPNGWNFGAPPTTYWTPIVGDFNGDGKTDFGFAGGTWIAVFLSKGDGTFSTNAFTFPNAWNFGNPPNSYTPIVGDFDGDGKTDFGFAAGTWIAVFLSKGDGTFAANAFNYPNAWNFVSPPSTNYVPIVGDFNGDGRTDFGFAAENWIAVFLSKGDGTFSGRPFTYPNSWNFFSPHLKVGYTPIVGDFNGDGKTDFAFAGGTMIFTFQANGQPNYQLNSVTSGLGTTTQLTYQPITNNSIYTKGTGSTYPTIDVQAPIYVVSRVDTSNGIGGTYSTTYSYAGAKADLSGRGFLGFRQVKATDLQTNVVATTNTRQDYPYSGLVASETKTLNAATLNATNNTYGYTALGGTRYQVFLTQSQVSSADLDGSAVPTVTSSYQYDAFGNATQVVVSATDGHSKTTTNTYTNDTAKWLLGRLTGATVTSQNSQPGSPPPVLPTPAIVTISSSAKNFNLWNYLTANNLATAGAPASANVTIAGGVVIGSASPSVPAFDTGTFPSGSAVQITNNGSIVGLGGNGGGGASCLGAIPAAPGSAGGPAVRAQTPLALANAGSIWGGGGGGGGGADDSFSSADGSSGSLGAGGGGGGAGFGAGGAAGLYSAAVAGSAGTASAGGPGGAGDTYTDSLGSIYSGGAGGTGGGPGLAGGNGSAGTAPGCYSASAGGAAGAAVLGNSFITWTTIGDRRGPLN